MMIKFSIKNVLPGFLIVLALLSSVKCTWSKDDYPENTFAHYQLKKVKELKINSLYPVGLLDYSPHEGLYLGYINRFSEGMEIGVFNEDGDIVVHKNREGEGPEEYTSGLISLGFSDEREIWALTSNQLLLYDHNLSLKERVYYEPSFSIRLYDRAEVFSYFFKNNSKSGLSFITNLSGIGRHFDWKDRDFRENHLIEVYHPNEDSFYELGAISQRSIHDDLDKSVGGLYNPIYIVNRKDSRLYLTATLDNEITVYDLNSNELVSRIAINHDDFNSLKTFPVKAQNLPSFNGTPLGSKNHKIHNLGNGLMALEYIRGIPYGTYERKKTEDPGYFHLADPDYHKLILFDQNRQLTSDLSVPQNANIIMGLPNNRLLVQPELNKEEDFIRFDIYEFSKEQD